MQAVIARCRGFSLIEIVAVVGIIGIVGGLIASTLTRQQRVFRATSETLEVRRSVRDAIAILAEEIRGASPLDTLRLMSDSAIELFTNIGSSVACTSLGAADVGITPTNPAGLSLTNWVSVPDTGDLALLYHSISSTAGSWERYRVRSVSSRSTSSACPAATGMSSGAGSSASSYVLTLSPAPATVTAGSPIRFIRRGRYSLYRSSDSRWYLGYRRCNAVGASSCGVIQPVSGYYQPFSADTSKTGILFRYFDESNHPLGAGSDPLLVARVQILARALSSFPVTLDDAAKTARDSTAVSAALRNQP